MSRPKHYWHSVARIMVKEYPNLKDGRSSQEELYRKAIDKAIDDTLAMTDGDLRMKAVKAVLFDKTKTYEGAAQDLNSSWRTVQNWVNQFVNDVGKNAGF